MYKYRASYINSRCYIGVFVDSTDVSLIMEKVKTSFQYVLWEKEYVENPKRKLQLYVSYKNSAPFTVLMHVPIYVTSRGNFYLRYMDKCWYVGLRGITDRTLHSVLLYLQILYYEGFHHSVPNETYFLVNTRYVCKPVNKYGNKVPSLQTLAASFTNAFFAMYRDYLYETLPKRLFYSVVVNQEYLC
jgi:hypothetical protein